MTSQELLSVAHTNFMIVAEAFALCGVIIGIVLGILGLYGYAWVALLLGVAPILLDVTAIWVYRKVLKPHKVGKYVLQHKQLPDDM